MMLPFLKRAATVCAVAAFLVSCWIALAVVIVFGALIDVMLFDRFYSLSLALTSAEQARWLWAGGLGFSLACYAIGVYRAATWFAIAPQIEQQRKAIRQHGVRPEPLEEHQIPKTAPSPEEIMRRGMPRG